MDEEQRKLQLDQQVDSVRYLNELNSVRTHLSPQPFRGLLIFLQTSKWLESFVNGGTVHIQSVAANVEQLCSHLGIFPESDTADDHPSGQGMLSEIRQLISSVQTKALDEGQLQASVGELMDAVREQMKNGIEQRTALGAIFKTLIFSHPR